MTSACPVFGIHRLSYLKFYLVKQSEAPASMSVINNQNPLESRNLSVSCLIRILGRIKSVMNPCKLAFHLSMVMTALHMYIHICFSVGERI